MWFAAGRVYIADSWAVRQMNPQTARLTMPAGTGAGPGTLGDGGPASKATVGSCGVAVDHSGNLVIDDQANDRVRVAAAGTGAFYGTHMTAGHIYTVAGDGTSGFSGDGGPATSAELNAPRGVAVDHSGNLVFADLGNGRIRVVAARTGTFYGQAMTAGDIYTVAGDGTAGFAGDGGAATSAELAGPTGLAVDAAGDLMLADTQNQRIRVVAVKTGTFYGRAMTDGDIYTIAGNGSRGFNGDGGPGTGAKLNCPMGMAADAAGNAVIADTFNSRIRVVAVRAGTFDGRHMTAGHIYTIAGNGTAGFAGDSGPATAAELHFPSGVAADAGNVVIVDSLNSRIRMVTG